MVTFSLNDFSNNYGTFDYSELDDSVIDWAKQQGAAHVLDGVVPVLAVFGGVHQLPWFSLAVPETPVVEAEHRVAGIAERRDG